MNGERERMVEQQIAARGVRDRRVLRALRAVDRRRFVGPGQHLRAHHDRPLPIGFEQTISQPYVVAYMSEQLLLTGDERVLEVGTGSGYQTAVLCELCREVYSIEIVPELARRAAERLARLDYRNLELRVGDGHRGWPEAAPFDAILVTASPSSIPPELVAQLRPDGRLVLPVGDRHQRLVRVTVPGGRTTVERLIDVRFVPMTGRAV